MATGRVNEPGAALEHPTKDVRSVLANEPLGPVVTTSYVVMKTVEERLRLLDGDVVFTTHSVHLLDDLETDHDVKVDVKAAAFNTKKKNQQLSRMSRFSNYNVCSVHFI